MQTGRPRKLNIYDFRGSVVVGITTNTNKEFTIDAKDYEKIKGYTWYENQCGYIETGTHTGGRLGSRQRMFLHRFLLDVHGKDWTKKQVDHINNNRTDNRRINLRVCVCGDNQINTQCPRKDNTSGTTGVYYEKRWRGRWIACINYRGKSIILGRFKDKSDAIKARTEAELFYYKDFSNIPNRQ